jgi:hypothetical protein
MRTFSILLGLAMIAFCVNASAATIFAEDFTYSTGMLSTTSGGVWNTWGGNSLDAVVASRMLVLDGIGGTNDVVAYHPNALPGAGVMTYSFDFYIHEEGVDEMDTYYFIGAGNPATYEIDYGNALGILMLDLGDTPGTTNVGLWDIDGDNGGGNYGYAVIAGGYSLDAWHNITIKATQTVVDPQANDPLLADGTYDIFVDYSLVFSGTFANNAAEGFNAIEIWSGANNEEHDFHAIDKINVDFEETIIPEPGMFALAGLGLLALIRRRK